uniref:Uncharacterized protein n=1 Tax=Electrophorus electricus TaxID=8005 RepID=A0AAY5ETJ0_ELEEL
MIGGSVTLYQGTSIQRGELLHLSEPLVSLPRLLNILNSFGKVSGYKVNLEKRELLAICQVIQSAARSQFLFKVNTKKFKYLGVWVL